MLASTDEHTNTPERQIARFDPQPAALGDVTLDLPTGYVTARRKSPYRPQK